MDALNVGIRWFIVPCSTTVTDLEELTCVVRTPFHWKIISECLIGVGSKLVLGGGGGGGGGTSYIIEL